MSEDKIYPSMVIRSQAEAIELLEQENQDLKEKIILLKASEPMLELEKYYGERDKYKEVIEEVREYVEDRISVLTVSVDNKAKDQYFNDKCIGGVQELKHIRHLLQILDKAKDSDD